jgi:cell surface protein SprA
VRRPASGLAAGLLAGLVALAAARALPAQRAAAPDTAARALPGPRRDLADLRVELNARLESKLIRSRNEICTAAQRVTFGSNCVATWLPGFDFQVNLTSQGTVGERIGVDVRYDSQNQFDASNTIALTYTGRPQDRLGRLAVGNVSFEAPASRFLTAGIPANNYGVQASGRWGPMRYEAILAQQRGNVSRNNVFTVGDNAVQQVERVIEDIQVESRRFFFTVDPRLLPGFPDIDILNRQALQRAAATLPDSIRPVRVYLYRQLINAQNQNPLGPQFSVRGARNPARQIYELLRENVDYYLDPSQLWVALVRPLQLNNERLVVAYEVLVDGQPGRRPTTGGTPDLQFTPEPQFANLLWEPELQPADSAYFLREIKSVYRLGGEELRRETVDVRIVTNTSGDQERPPDPSRGQTYLQLFGLAEATNAARFDVENRLWPRPNDPNRAATGQAGQPLVRDYFIVFPSLQPFARAGLARPAANPANDTLYRVPNEYLYSAQRPQSIFRLIARYESRSDGDAGGISLGTTQLRPGSERLELDGLPLVRGRDYEVTYETGRITFNRPDTLFLRPRTVNVRYEENPLFALAATPTTILGLTTRFPVEAGQFTFTAISQEQRAVANRPALGYEPVGSLVAGLTSDLAWEAPQLSRLAARLGLGTEAAASRVALAGEFAMSRPRPNAAGQAFLESFEGEAGVQVPLGDALWYYGSRPQRTDRVAALAGLFTPERASTLAWQNSGRTRSGLNLVYTIDQIDPAARFTPGGLQPPEPVLFLTLYPQRAGGLLGFDAATGRPTTQWTVGGVGTPATPAGRRWRSLRTVLNPSGSDLSRVEQLEFYALVYTDPVRAVRNPTLVFDFGELSENSLVYAPDTLVLRPHPTIAGRVDSLFRGRVLDGLDRLDSERDPLTRAFNALVDDTGLPGSVAERLIVIDSTGPLPATSVRTGVPICSGTLQAQQLLGDSRANCTARNNRLDDEDIDLDGQLNMTDAVAAEQERFKRFVVDLSDRRSWTRVGRCQRGAPLDAPADSAEQCWVQVRLNWRAPTDSVGAQNDRRVRALRLSVVSQAPLADTAFVSTALARLRLVGAPWLKRTERPISGLAGDSLGTLTGGYVLASVIGSLDSSATVPYEPPPGVAEVPDERLTGLEASRVQVNERALRLQAGGAPGQRFRPFDRAEAFFRFPEGLKSVMGYRTLRLWMRGRGNGWGPGGELNGYVKLGRDEHNFYAYRTPVNAGASRNAWEPEVRVDLQRFQALRARLENLYLSGSADSIACSGPDLELVRRSGLPTTGVVRRYAVCEDGYIVYTTDPTVTPPSLAGVQELAVGFVRVDSLPRGADAIAPNDTLELWVNDVRLSDVVNDLGFAGELALTFNAGEFMDVRAAVRRRDPNFRQLGEAPSFLTENGYTLGTTLHLERALPARLGLVAPLSIDYTGSDAEQLFVNRSDIRADGIRGLRNPRVGRVNYALSVRRAEPLAGRWYAPLVNGASLNAAWGSGTAQSAFQSGRSSAYRVNATLDLGGGSHRAPLPAWLTRPLRLLPASWQGSPAVRALRETPIEWRPAQLRITSGLSRDAMRTTSFLKPAVAPGDTGQVAAALQHAWTTAAVVAFTPLPAVTARVDARHVRDLRDYDALLTRPDSADRLAAFDAARARWLGTPVGLERERTLTGGLRIAPTWWSWLRPRAELVTGFSLVADPNARVLLRLADSSARLPRRLGATQDLTGGVTFDPLRLAGRTGPSATAPAWWARALQPLDVTWTRTLDSNYDAVARLPGGGYQFGVGGVDLFRGLDGPLATAAGQSRRLIVSGGLTLPLALSLATRAELGRTETWTRRGRDGAQALMLGAQDVYPDLTLRWNWRPPRPLGVLAGIGASAGYAVNALRVDAPNELGGFADRSRGRAERLPVSASVTWSLFGPLVTAASYSRTARDDERPGALTRSRAEDAAVSISRTFPLPARWRQRSGLRTQLAWQKQGSRSVVTNDVPGLLQAGNAAAAPPGMPFRSVLADNGREAWSANADTDLSDTMTFSLSGARVVTFDRTFNRRFAQTTFSAVLQLNFFGGAVR